MHVTSAIRYGDPISVDGDVAAMATMRSYLKPDGVAIVAVPVSQTAAGGAPQPVAHTSPAGGRRCSCVEFAPHVRTGAPAAAPSRVVHLELRGV